jgi:type I restriction enzyme S subunit
MMGLEPYESVLSPRFLMYAMTTKDLALIANPGAVPSVNGSQIAEERIWCPAPSDQERIVNFLDDKTTRIDALIAEKELLVARLKEFQHSHSSELMTRGGNPRVKLVRTSFPEIGQVPDHWTVERLKFLGEVRSGVAKGKDLGEKNTVTLPYLRVANVQDGYVDLSEVLDIEVAESEASRYLLKKNDVLMNEGGDNDKLGRGTVWQGQIDPCIHQNHVFAVRLLDPGLAEWVARFTSTDAARAYFFLRSKQSTNLASINQSNVLELPVPMPPQDERKALLAEIRRSALATTNLIQNAVEHISRLREYRSSLISAAVTGQVDLGVEKCKEAA